MKLAEALEVVRRHGRRGDTELAHVNPREKAILKAMGGSGGMNPKTGMREYAFDPGTGLGSDPGADTASGMQEGGFGSADERGGFPASTPSAFDFVGRLENPQTAGPTLAGALGGFGLGALASLMQGINDRYYGGEARAFGGTPSTGEFQASIGPEGGVGGDVLASALGTPTPSYLRPSVGAIPGELSQLLGPGMTNLQQRAAIGTFGTQGANSAFRGEPARKYYASLLAQELVRPEGGLNEAAYLLPVEQQYLGSAFGRQASTPSQAYEAIRGTL